MAEAISVILASKAVINLPQVNGVLDGYDEVERFSTSRSGSQIRVAIEAMDGTDSKEFLTRLANDLHGSLQGVESGIGTYNFIRLDKAHGSSRLLRRLGRFPNRGSRSPRLTPSTRSSTDLTGIPGQRSSTLVSGNIGRTNSVKSDSETFNVQLSDALTGLYRFVGWVSYVWLGLLTALAIATEPLSRDDSKNTSR